jgi:hypothetical protein
LRTGRRPSCSALATYGQRLVANSGENPYALYFSKLIVEGYGISWADELVRPVNGGFGEITGLVQMDDKLVIFQKRAISIVSGAGLDNTGNGVDFGDVVQIATDVGCTTPASIVADRGRHHLPESEGHVPAQAGSLYRVHRGSPCRTI